MRYFLYLIILFFWTPLSLFSQSAEGTYTLQDMPNGNYRFNYEIGNISVETVFPGKPEVAGSSATYLLENPLVQLTLLIAPNDKTTPEELTQDILDIVKDDYKSMNIALKNERTIPPQISHSEKGSTYYQQYILDLDVGTREFLTVSVFMTKEWDVLTYARVILSKKELKNLSQRAKANSLANQFHSDTVIHFTN